MDNNTISISEALQISNKIFIDVRSPKEYEDFHIPGAVNIPLLSNEERHNIGLMHKEKGPVAARREGLKVVASKLPSMVDQYTKLSEQGRLILYCWRGGMRSQSISNVLELVKVKHARLAGGYNAYRKYIVNYLASVSNKTFVVLHGLTGVGKTLILHQLQKLGAPFIDIEAHANHRGSAFGSVGLGDQPSQKKFESFLFDDLVKFEKYPYIIVECESRRTGRLNLPDHFFSLMKEGQHLLVYVPLATRVERIVKEYGPATIHVSELENSIKKLEKRLGNLKVEYLLKCLSQNDINQIVEILLTDYYDPLYGYSDKPDDKYDASFSALNISNAANSILEWCKEKFEKD